MRRGEFYRMRRPPNDPKPNRVFMVVSRDEFIAAKYSTVMAIPVYSSATGVHTEVTVGTAEGLPHVSFLRCDEVTSVPKTRLTDYVGAIDDGRMAQVEDGLLLALGIPR